MKKFVLNVTSKKPTVKHLKDGYLLTYKRGDFDVLMVRENSNFQVTSVRANSNDSILAGGQYRHSPITRAWWWIASSFVMLALLYAWPRKQFHFWLCGGAITVLTLITGTSFAWNEGVHSARTQTIVWTASWIVLLVVTVCLLIDLLRRKNQAELDSSAPRSRFRTSHLWIFVFVVAVVRSILVWKHAIHSDVGLAGSVGAELYLGGADIYTSMPAVSGALVHGDTYPVLNYLLYAPAMKIGALLTANDVYRPAAMATSLAFDALCLASIALVARKWFASWNVAGWLAAMWVATPLTTATLLLGTNDMAIPITLLCALAYSNSAYLRGLWLGIGASIKFVPLLAIPAMWKYEREKGIRTPLIFAGGFLTSTVICMLIVLKMSHGFHRFYNETIRFQLERVDGASVWGHLPSWAHSVLGTPIAVAILAVAFVLPKSRTRTTLASLSAVAMIVGQLTTRQWAFAYITWALAPLLLLIVLQAEPMARREEERDPLQS